MSAKNDETSPGDAALLYHLKWNHWPPYRPENVQVARQAIAHARDGDLQAPVTLLSGEVKTAAEVITDLHLEGFVE